MTVLHNFFEDRLDPPLAGEFYKHPYGGIGRDITVSYEGFCRFFELQESDMDIARAEKFYGKVVDLSPTSDIELCGYRGHRYGNETWTITFIDRSYIAHIKQLERELEEFQKQHPEFEPKFVVGGVLV